jgi:hypothetical protein
MGLDWDLPGAPLLVGSSPLGGSVTFLGSSLLWEAICALDGFWYLDLDLWSRGSLAVFVAATRLSSLPLIRESLRLLRIWLVSAMAARLVLTSRCWLNFPAPFPRCGGGCLRAFSCCQSTSAFLRGNSSPLRSLIHNVAPLRSLQTVCDARSPRLESCDAGLILALGLHLADLVFDLHLDGLACSPL